MERKVINPENVHVPMASYSHGVKVGNMVFLAGQCAVDLEGNIIGKDNIEAQTRLSLDNLKHCLEDVGATLNDVVHLNIYMTNLARDRIIAGKVREEFFGDFRPPSTLVEVKSLAYPDYLIEIQAIAVIS